MKTTYQYKCKTCGELFEKEYPQYKPAKRPQSPCCKSSSERSYYVPTLDFGWDSDFHTNKLKFDRENKLRSKSRKK